MSKIKIFGLSRLEDIDIVNDVLPEYVGFVFTPSRRRVEIKRAAMLKEALDSRIKAVGVFVNENIKSIEKICKSGIIDIVQLHGDENDIYIKRFKEGSGCHIIKAVAIGDILPPLPAEADNLLFDTHTPHRGGTGQRFNWSILKQHCGSPYFLAGGLTIENVSNAMLLLDPYCVDVSSGVETNGIKDANKIQKFVNIVRRSTG